MSREILTLRHEDKKKREVRENRGDKTEKACQVSPYSFGCVGSLSGCHDRYRIFFDASKKTVLHHESMSFGSQNACESDARILNKVIDSGYKKRRTRKGVS